MVEGSKMEIGKNVDLGKLRVAGENNCEVSVENT